MGGTEIKISRIKTWTGPSDHYQTLHDIPFDGITITVHNPDTEPIDTQECQETVHNLQDTGTADIPANSIQDEIKGLARTVTHYIRGVKKYGTSNPASIIYLHFLLRLPYLYLGRVDRLFSDVNLSMPQILKFAIEISIAGQDPQSVMGENLQNDPKRDAATVAYLRLQTRWKNFMDALMEEWKALNMIGVLLLGAIMTMFQIDGAAQDPVTRYVAFCSLICSLMSLLHGCMFIVRFSTMRRPSRAINWALEVQKHVNPFWNVWVMLSMPLLWLTWSIITFIICIMTFMWRSRVQLPDDFVFSVPPHTEPGARILVSCVLGIGMIHTCLILYTLRQYGSKMDDELDKLIHEKVKLYKAGTVVTKWQSHLLRGTKSSTNLKVARKGKKLEVGKTEDRQRTPADSFSEERNSEVGDSGSRRRSSESPAQERQQQLPDTPRDITHQDRQHIGFHQLPEGTKHQAETFNGQQPQYFSSAAKAQDEVFEGTKGALGNVSGQRSHESRENDQQGITEVARQ